MQREYTHDGEPITKALQSLNHSRPATLAGLAVCITGIVPNLKGTQAETAAQRRGARTTKNSSQPGDAATAAERNSHADLEER